MMVCALREAARMVAIRGTARTMWNMINYVERIRKGDEILPSLSLCLTESVYLYL